MYNYHPYEQMRSINPLTGAHPHQLMQSGMNPNLHQHTRGLANTMAPRSSGGLLGLGSNAGTGLARTGLSGINWSGLFGNAQKALGFINQTLPVYNQVKPVVNNARTMFRVMKAMKDDPKSSAKPQFKESINQEQTLPTNSSIAINKRAPTFFK